MGSITSRLLMFLLLLGSLSSTFALSSRDLQKKAVEVQQKLHLSGWQFLVRFVSLQEMLEKNQCRCFGETLIFPTTKVAVVNILDDAGYKELGWEDMNRVHANEKFAVLHEVLHVFVEVEHPDFDIDKEELSVQQIARMIEVQPELR